MKTRTCWWKTLCVALLGVAGPAIAGQPPGTLRWSFDAGSAIHSSPALAADGAVYFTTADQRLIALNPSGTLRWTAQTNLGTAVWSSPTVGDDGTVYLSSSRSLAAAKPDGTWRWINPTNGSGVAPVGIANDGAIVSGAGEGWIYCLNRDGSRRWSFRTYDHDTEPPAITGDGTIIFGSYHLFLYGISAAGIQRWSQQNYSLFDFSPVLEADGRIYGASGQNLYSFQVDGASNWTFQATAPLRGSAAIGPDHTVYFTTEDGLLHALLPTGIQKWKSGPVATSEAGLRTCPALAEDGTIYLASVGRLYAFDGNGTNLWTFAHGISNAVESSVSQSSPVIGDDGTVYFGTASGYLHAVQGSAALANAPWPMYRRDPRHTSRAGGTATRRPQIRIRHGSSDLIVTVSAEWGRSYRLESSRDLASWDTIARFTVATSAVDFHLDPRLTGDVQFHRVVSP